MNNLAYDTELRTPFNASKDPCRIVALNPQRDWWWVKATIGCLYVEDTTGLLAIDKWGNYAAAFILDSWTKNAVQGHIAVLNPFVIRHGFFEHVANFIFNQCAVKVVIGLTPANNYKALRLDKHIGFEEVHRIKDGYDDDVDYVVLEMRKENCRWLRGNNDGR
jgi:hypothetical protein